MHTPYILYSTLICYSIVQVYRYCVQSTCLVYVSYVADYSQPSEITVFTNFFGMRYVQMYAHAVWFGSTDVYAASGTHLRPRALFSCSLHASLPITISLLGGDTLTPYLQTCSRHECASLFSQLENSSSFVYVFPFRYFSRSPATRAAFLYSYVLVIRSPRLAIG